MPPADAPAASASGEASAKLAKASSARHREVMREPLCNNRDPAVIHRGEACRCLAPLIVTLLNRMVFGLVSRFGAMTASSDVKPSLLLVSALQKAVSAAEPRGPISRSM